MTDEEQIAAIITAGIVQKVNYEKFTDAGNVRLRNLAHQLRIGPHGGPIFVLIGRRRRYYASKDAWLSNRQIACRRIRCRLLGNLMSWRKERFGSLAHSCHLLTICITMGGKILPRSLEQD